MAVSSFTGKVVLITLVIAILFLAHSPVWAGVTVSGGPELMSADELQQLVRLAVTKGKIVDLGEDNSIKYLDFEKAGLRQYITVEGTTRGPGLYEVRSIVLMQELWTKSEPDKDVINQWIISIQPYAIETFHVQLLECDDKVIEATPLPAESKEVLGVARAIIKTFLQP